MYRNNNFLQMIDHPSNSLKIEGSQYVTFGLGLNRVIFKTLDWKIRIFTFFCLSHRTCFLSP